MPNPFRTPRPYPVDPGMFEESPCMDELLERGTLSALIQRNFDWLCHEERSTREIYTTLFRNVDLSTSRQQEGMIYLNEALWDMGFSMVKVVPYLKNPSWKWEQPA